MQPIRLNAFVLLSLLLSASSGARQDAVTALIGGMVIDGTGRPGYAATIIIRGRHIVEVGKDSTAPTGATVIDVSGQSVVPGLVDMHGHMYARATADMRSQFDAYPALYLAGGVTTVRSPGDFDPEGMIALRDRIARGDAVGPRMFVAGPYFDHAPSQVLWIKGTTTADEALTLFQSWKSRVDWIKFYTRITEAQFVAVSRAARDAGIPTTAHLGSITAARAIELGITGLEHGLFGLPEVVQGATGDPNCARAAVDLDSPAMTALVASIVQHRTVIDPTTIVYQFAQRGFQPVTPDWTRYLSDAARTHQERPRPPATPEDDARAECLNGAIAKQLAFVKRVHDAGGIVVAGTDPVSPRLTPGYALQRELKNLVDAGLTPVAAIKAATSDAARALGRSNEIGTIARGMLADLVVVAGPVEGDITRIGETVHVFKDGDRYEPDRLRRGVTGQIR